MHAAQSAHTPVLISIDKKFASPLCDVSFEKKEEEARERGYHISGECQALQRECLNSI